MESNPPSEQNTSANMKIDKKASQDQVINKSIGSRINSLYKQIVEYPMVTSAWISSIIFILQFAHIMHIIDFYHNSINVIYPKMDITLTVYNLLIPSILPFIYVASIILTLVSVITCLYNENKYEGIRYIICWLGVRVLPFLRYIIEINLIITAYFLIIDTYCLILFIVSGIINLLITFFKQNYSFRKDYLCCKSMGYLILYKCIMIVSYGVDCFGYRYASTANTLIIFMLIQLVLGVVLFVSYFSFGYVMYRHSTPRVLLVFNVNLFVATTLGLLLDILNLVNGQYGDNRHYIYIPLLVVGLLLVSYSLLSRMRRVVAEGSLSQRIYFLYGRLEGSAEDIEDDCDVRGVIRLHSRGKCSNHECFTNCKEIHYDSKKNKTCSVEKINQGKTSLVKFYIKCMYERELEKSNWTDTSLLLEYIEFYYTKLKNIFRVTHLMVNLSGKFLSPFHKLRLERLKRLMWMENSKLNKQLYLGNLDIECIIDCQSEFSEIRRQVTEVLDKNKKLWDYMNQNTIDLSLVTHIIQPNFKLVDQINNHWKRLAQYFEVHKKWKFYFACYTLYIKNQKLKPTFLEYFGNNVHEDEVFSEECYHLEKAAQSTKLFNPQMLFQSNTAVIHISNHLEEPIILRVNSYFYKMFRYDQKSIIKAPIDSIMPPTIRNGHQIKFLEWAGKGKSNNEATYQVKKIYPIDNLGYIIPVFKFYKQFYNLNNHELEYIAMFKKNKEDEYTALLNSNYQIEGLTKAFCDKLKINHQSYTNLVNINMLVLFPTLLKYTKFQSEVEKGDQVFYQENKRAGGQTSQKQLLGKRPSNGSKKDISKSNIKIAVPTNFVQIAKGYQSAKLEKGIYQGIKQAYKLSKNIEQSLKIKMDIEIKQKIISDHVYYEAYFRDIEQISNSTTNYHIKQKKKSNQPSKLQPNQVLIQEFHKFFENSQNNQSISLAFSNNIFIKEDNNKAVDMIEYVGSISLLVRLFFCIFMGLVIATLFVELNNQQAYNTLGKKMLYTTLFDLKFFMLENKYFQIEAKFKNIDIKPISNEILQINLNHFFKKSILDQTINQNNKYYAYNGSLLALNRNYSSLPVYDQIDLVDKMIQSVISIKNVKTFSVDDIDLQYLQAYAIPSFETLGSNIKKNLNSQFQKIKRTTYVKNIIFYSIQSLLLILGFVVVLSRIIRISKSFVSLMEIFTQFTQNDLQKVQKYSSFLINLFKYLGLKHDGESNKGNSYLQSNNSQHVDGLQENDEAAINLNKKVKKVQIGQALTQHRIKSIFFVVIFLILYGISGFVLNIYVEYSAQDVITFQNNGYSIFKYYSVLNRQYQKMVDAIAPSTPYYGDASNRTTNDLFQMRQVKNRIVTSDSSSLFIKRYNSLMFQNFCNDTPALIQNNKTKITECSTAAESSLQHGLQSFIFYIYAESSNLFGGDPSSYPAQKVQNIGIALRYCNRYMIDLIYTWQRQIQAKVNIYQNNITIICFTLILFQILIYIILIEIFVVGNLQKKFLFFKKIYEMYMPDFIVSKEKIIKAKLIVQGIIKK